MLFWDSSGFEQVYVARGIYSEEDKENSEYYFEVIDAAFGAEVDAKYTAGDEKATVLVAYAEYTDEDIGYSLAQH